MSEPIVLGGASWNLMIQIERFPLPQPATIHQSRSHEAAGSTGMGKALALAALGHRPFLHGTIGDDTEGRAIRAVCDRRRVSAHFDIDPGGTARHVNLMNALGERISIFLFNGSPDLPVDVGNLTPRLLAAETIFLNITQSSVPLLPAVRASRADVWVDLHDYDGTNPWHEQFIAEADVIQLSDEQVNDVRPLMRRLGERARLVICTRGIDGALAYADGRWHEVPAVPARLIDSNGAGDTFMVALWHALQQNRTLPDALRFAAAAAAIAVESEELVPEAMSEAAVDARA